MFRYLLPLFILMLVGCSKTPTVDYDPKFETASLQSFAIVSKASKQSNPLNEERIRDAIMAEMQKKGYTTADKETADFRISFESVIKEEVPSNVSVGFGFGSFSNGLGTSIATSHRPTKDQGKLHINMINPKTEKTFWRTVYTKDIRDFSSPQARSDYFKAIVAAMLKDFPSHTPPIKTKR